MTVDGLGIPETGLRVPGKLLGLGYMLGARLLFNDVINQDWNLEEIE